jgi:cyanophycinase
MLIFYFTQCAAPVKEGDEAVEASINNKGKLVIIGGGSRGSELIQRIADESGLVGGGYGYILPMASEEPDSSAWYAAQSFESAGVADQLIAFSMDSAVAPSPSLLDSLRQASLIYISGGDQQRFMDAIQGTGVGDAMHAAYANGALIAGTSAGAAIMSKKMITGNELKHPEYYSTFRHLETDNLELSEGLGLLQGAIIDQHFVRRSRYNRLINAVLVYPELMGIGIDESTAILVSSDSAEVVGVSQVVVISNPEQSYQEYDEKIGGKALRVDIYLPGEKFALP